jgi:hypothetical protein
MARHVAGPIVKYDDIFFDWLQNQMLMVDDYAHMPGWISEEIQI